MMTTLKAEFRKLLSVRSTYIITALVVALVIFVAFYINGWRLSPADLHDPSQLASDVTGALNITVFGAIVGILLMTHEYRYNTIMYTLTSSNSRSKVLLAKFITVSAYALFLAVLIGVLSPIMSYLGVHLHGHALVPQTLHYGNLAWRSLFYGWGYGMAGLLLAVLSRNQVASIVALFLIPDLGEQLLGLLLKHNTVYLPFSSLNQVIRYGTSVRDPNINSSLSPGKAAGVYCIYLVVGGIVAWILFLRRDAS
jgi:ABC-type transport system involved in multi-copper enzyme maturation permease subunit